MLFYCKNDKISTPFSTLGFLRLSRRALDTHPHNEPNRIDLCYDSPSDDSHQELRVEEYIVGLGLSVNADRRKEVVHNTRV